MKPSSLLIAFLSARALMPASISADDAGINDVASKATPAANTLVDASAKADVSVTAEPVPLDSVLYHLQQARELVGSLNSYSAVLEMQEVVNGRPREAEVVDLKLRQQPFGVYMRWRVSSQEAIFVDGQNDNRLIVRPTNGLAAIRRVWKIAPDSKMALQSARYPITDSGLLKLCDRVSAFYETLTADRTGITCLREHGKLNDMTVTTYRINFPSAEVSPEYSHSRYSFDSETNFLVHVENYSWESGDSPLELYSYHTIKKIETPAEAIFDHSNPEYGFVAKAK